MLYIMYVLSLVNVFYKFQIFNNNKMNAYYKLYSNETVCLKYIEWRICHGLEDMDEVGCGGYA